MRIRVDGRALTRIQGLLVIVTIVVAAAIGAYYYQSPHLKKKLEIHFWYESSGHWPQSEDQAMLYKAQLERTGLVTVILHSVDYVGYKKNRLADVMPVYMASWYADYLDPDNYVLMMHSTRGAFLHTYYSSPEMDRLIEQAQVTPELATRKELYSQIQSLMVQDAPIVPVWQGRGSAVTKSDVRGVTLDMLEYMRYWMIESPRESLIVGTTDSVATTLDPAETYSVFEMGVILNTGASLVYTSPEFVEGSETFVPGLATRWSASADGLTWTFDLRKGVRFSDGTEFDANAVKYSFDRSMNLYLPASSLAAIGYRDIIDGVEVISKYQVVFHLKIPFAPFLSLMAFQGSFIVNPKLAPLDKAVQYVEGDARASNPNDLGPYLLTSWVRKGGKDYEMRFDFNPNYWGIADGYPKTKHIFFRFYSDATALALSMKSGEIDMAYRQLAAADLRKFQTDPTVKVWQGPGGFIQYICFQEKIPPLNNSKVRQAIAAALDRKELIDTVFLGQAMPAYSMIPSGMAFHQDAYKILGDANITFTVNTLKELGYG